MTRKKIDNKKKFKWLKYIFIALGIALFVAIIIWLIPIMKNITTEEGRLEFKNKMDSLGIWSGLVLFVMQFAQIFLVILPGEPMEILAGMCYGTFWGTLFIFLSVFIITTFIVLLVKLLGTKFVYSIWDRQKIKRIKNNRAFKNKKRIEIIMTILFLIPGTPKDLLTYIGALLPIDVKRFIFISTFARFPSVISSTMAGANIVKGDFTSMFLIYIVTFAITGVLIYFTGKVDKDAKEAMDALK
ncbi:MAG: TVP38/TMEM64 family protein [Clostridia bacterium]|nr:TVP38/TMEM64 family protein [Clostridia bacterium]